MYLIANESDKILFYAYQKIDYGFSIKINFDEFKSDTQFQYRKEDFLNSLFYLSGTGAIKNDTNTKWDITQPFYQFYIMPQCFKFIEDNIMKD